MGLFSLTDLIHDILDLIAESLVFTPDLIKLSNRFFICRLHSEEIRGGIAAFFLCNIQIHAEAINLPLPFTYNLVKLSSLFLHLIVQDLSLVKVDSHLFNLSTKFALGFFNLSQFTIEILNGSFSFSESSLQFHFGHLQLFCFSYSFRLILSMPHSSLTLSLRCLPVNIFTASNFFIKCLFHAIKFMFYILVLAQKKLPLSGFIISNMFSILKCSLQGKFHLLNHVDIVGNVTSYSKEIIIFCSQSPLVRFKISKCHISFLNLLS